VAIQRTPMTRQGYERLKVELERLKKVERPSITKAIAEARSHGDLWENAEYHAAKEKQSFIEGRIVELEAKVGQAEVIDLIDEYGVPAPLSSSLPIMVSRDSVEPYILDASIDLIPVPAAILQTSYGRGTTLYQAYVVVVRVLMAHGQDVAPKVARHRIAHAAVRVDDNRSAAGGGEAKERMSVPPDL